MSPGRTRRAPHRGASRREQQHPRERSAMLSNSIHLYHNRIHALFVPYFHPASNRTFFSNARTAIILILIPSSTPTLYSPPPRLASFRPPTQRPHTL